MLPGKWERVGPQNMVFHTMAKTIHKKPVFKNKTEEKQYEKNQEYINLDIVNYYERVNAPKKEIKEIMADFL